MRGSLALATLAVMASLSAAAAQDAQSILTTMRAKQLARWATVDNYTVRQTLLDAPGIEKLPSGAPVYFEKTTEGGETAFRMVPQKEYMREAMRKAGCPEMTPDDMRLYARGYDLLGPALSRGGGDMPANGGMPGVDLGTQAGDIAEMLRGIAAAEDTDRSPDATVAAGPAMAFVQRARLEGVEPALASTYGPDGNGQDRAAFHLVAEGLSDVPLPQPEGGGRFTLQRIGLWVDTAEYVPLRLLMEGTLESGGRAEPITIERLDLAYAPAGPLYEPRQHVYRLSGLMGAMSEKDARKLEKAREQLAEIKAKLAAMPASQRAMVMKMMGSQMQRLEEMTSTGDLTSVVNVVDIAVNKGPPLPVDPDGKSLTCR